MADNCTYIYKDKKYSKDRLTRILVDELPIRDQQESIRFLVDYTGMQENEVIIVKGLIDNTSLGRFKADARVLLSEYANIGVAYHEAFHRIWRIYLTKEERLQIIKEVKTRKNIQSLIKTYQEVYPKLDENELIEEILADEFADYAINTDFKIELPIKSVFHRLVNFLKKLLGLKTEQIQMIYDKILSKQFKGVPRSVDQYLKDADKILIQGYDFTVEQKNEIIQVLTQQFVKAMLEVNGDIDLFLNNPTSKIKNLVDEYVVANMLSDISDNVPESDDLITAIYEDIDQWLSTNDSTKSVFINGMFQNLRLLGLEIKDDQVEDESEGTLDNEEKQSREFTSSVELDPRSNMGKKIKLLLSSLSDTSEKTPNFGFDRPLSWTKAFVQIGSRMAGIPTSVFMEELQNLDLSYAPELIEILNKDSIFRNKFISTMAMTENTFLVMNYKDGDIYFFDANSGTKRDKLLREWQNNLIRKIEDWDSWVSKLQTIESKISKTTDQEILDHFGLVVNFSIENLKKDLHVIVNKAIKYNGPKPDSKRIFEVLGIRGFVTNLANKQSAFEDQVDLMVNLSGKKLYTLGLNTQQTTVLNAIRYAQTRFTPEMTTAQKIEVIKRFAPFQVSEFNVTQLSNGEYLIHNEWLKRILDGERIDLVIPYSVKTGEGEQLEISKLDEADLMSLHVNGALQGVNMSMKHADRSTFFAYKFNTPLYDKSVTPDVQSTLDILVNNIKEQIELEAKLVRNMRDLNLPIQHLGQNYENLAFASIIGKDEFQKVLDGDLNINTTPIYKVVREQFTKYQNDITNYGLLESYQEPIYKDGKKSGNISRVKGINNSLLNDYGSLELLLASAFVNEVSSHIFEVRFFSGDVRSFKNGTDLFKRLSPQSSTGNLSVNSVDSQKDIRVRLDQEFQVLNPLTGALDDINPSHKIGDKKDKYFRAVTGVERDNYKSHLLDLATTPLGKPIISKFTGQQESKLFLMFEDGFIKDFPDKSIEELKKTYLSKIRLYEDKYSSINENDGQSYMTLPAFKNFMIRQGNWTDGMELVYQVEMKIASLKSKEDIANIEIEFKGVTFKPFQVNPTTVNGKKYNGWSKRVVDGKLIKLDAVHTLKTQFGGYSTPEEYFDQVRGEIQYTFNSVFKTSQHLLQPSTILGTNLQLMNYSLLTNGIDIYHMGSANKVGGVDSKLAAKNIVNNDADNRNTRTFISDISERGLDFYDRNGNFNHKALTENLDILTYLSEWDYLKDQVNVGNKVKTEIKGSTQSLKILLSNLVVNGQERFVGAQKLIQNYKELVKEIVKENHNSLLKKIGYDIDTEEFKTFDQLKKSVLGSSQMLNAPENVRNSVENFFNDPGLGLEVVPLKNKIENVLYSLITNGIISFDRPGSSYPQAAITGYEELGSRKFNEDGTQQSNQETLKFYNPIFDEDGNLTKVEPAEVIMPLPDYWIKPLLRWAKTNNLALALDKLNADIKVRPELYQFKGLRIPNQQLSSNEFLQVKQFNLPTMQNYILVPSEIVVKAGSDFDIDKMNIYWAKDTENKIFHTLTEDEILEKYENYVEVAGLEGEDILSYQDFKAVLNTTVDRLLLDTEREILLHPRNAHHLLMPLTDEIFVKDIYGNLVKEGLITEPQKSFFAAMLPSINVKNTVIFVKGKFGVGIGALGITNKATNQADILNISQTYRNQEGVVRPTKLLFKGLGDNYSLDAYTDDKGTIVSEIQSQLLTTQVDNVKNPTAVLMNINMQTLNIVDYLVRRTVNPESVVLLINQPLIKEYLIAQKNNESLLNKNSDQEVGKKQLISNLLKDKSYEVTVLPDPYDTTKDQVQLEDKMMRDNIKKNKFDKDQLDFLAYFLELQNQARAFSDFQQTQTSDTKGLKDKQMLDESEVIRGRVGLSQIITPQDVSRLDTEGVISPFYQFGRKRYSIYDQFYSLASSKFGNFLFNFKNKASIVAKSDNKDRVRQTIENDFVLFLVHSFITNKAEFDRLMKDQSVAKRVQDLKLKLPSNLVLKAFFPMLNTTTDLTDNKKLDNLRLFEKELNQLDNNDLRLSLEEIAEADIDLYNDIVKLLMFQTGLNISPFNYRSIVPVGLNQNRNEFNEYHYLYQDILSNSIKEMNKQVKTQDDAKQLFEKFVTLFSANNPQFLRKNFFHPEYPYTLARTFNRDVIKYGPGGERIVDKTVSMWVLRPKKGNEAQIQLGDAYHKQYFIELINPNLGNKVIKQSGDKQALNTVFNEETEIINPQQSTGQTQEVPQKTSVIKTLPMQPDNIEQIKAGTKTITNRTGKFDDGVYKLPDGTLAQVTYLGKAKVTEKGIEIGDNIREKDNFAKAEGFKSWIDFVENNKFSKDFINGKQSRYIYKIDSYQPIEFDQSQSVYSPSLKIYEDFIKLNQLYTGNEILPFIGESEYYRYLVPMLLNMNPSARSMFTHHMKYYARELGLERNMDLDFFRSLDNTIIDGKVGAIAVRELDASFVRPDETIKAVVHELVHLTLQKEYEKGTEFKTKIDNLYAYAWDRQVTDGTYGFTSPKEFLAEALSNPDFMEELNDIQYQDETVWSYLMTLVSDFINNLLNIELKSDSVLAEVVRVSEQILNNNVSEMSKNNKVQPTQVEQEMIDNWNNYFPEYGWMNDVQKQMTAKLASEGKITLSCKI